MAKRVPPPRAAGLFADGAPEAKPVAAAYRANIDGGSRGNPGPAAYGVVIRDAKGDVVAKRHNGHALAQVKDGQCKGCGLRVLPHTLQLLTQDHDDEEIFRCESCGLILYSLEPLTAVNPDAASGSAASATIP